jgi:VIT1/CCC1 family predicted Fe2+/Mn2+ transporter
MALGEWISVRSSTEAFEQQLRVEREELEEFPEEEEEELALIYRAKGLSPEDARETARRIISNQATALETLAREELGMSIEEASGSNAWVAAVTSFLLFAVGAIFPVLPWLFVGGTWGIVASAMAAGAGLVLAGAATSLFTGRTVLFSGARMLLIGAATAAVTFGIGFGVGKAFGIDASSV